MNPRPSAARCRPELRRRPLGHHPARGAAGDRAAGGRARRLRRDRRPGHAGARRAGPRAADQPGGPGHICAAGPGRQPGPDRARGLPAGRGGDPRRHDPRRGRRDSALPAGPGRPGPPVRSGPRGPGGRPGPGGRLSPAGRDPARGAGRDGRAGHPAGHPPGPRAAVRRRACGGGRRAARTRGRGQPQRAGAGIGTAGGPGPGHLARVHRRGDGRDRRRRVRGQPDRPGQPPGPVRLELADPDPGRGRIRELRPRRDEPAGRRPADGGGVVQLRVQPAHDR